MSTTTHHQPKYIHLHPPLSPTTYHQPKYVHHHPPPVKICPPRPTTTHQYLPKTHYQPKYIHHHPPLAKIYPPLPTSSQKMDHHHAKAKIYSYITSFRHCVNSFFFFEMHYSFPWWRFCAIKFWSVCFSNSRFPLHLVHFTIFKSFWSLCFTSLRLQVYIVCFYK